MKVPTTSDQTTKDSEVPIPADATIFYSEQTFRNFLLEHELDIIASEKAGVVHLTLQHKGLEVAICRDGNAHQPWVAPLKAHWDKSSTGLLPSWLTQKSKIEGLQFQRMMNYLVTAPGIQGLSIRKPNVADPVIALFEKPKIAPHPLATEPVSNDQPKAFDPFEL